MTSKEWLLKALAEKLNTTLVLKPFDCEDDGPFEVDGYSASQPVLCEVWGHTGITFCITRHFRPFRYNIKIF